MRCEDPVTKGPKSWLTVSGCEAVSASTFLSSCLLVYKRKVIIPATQGSCETLI